MPPIPNRDIAERQFVASALLALATVLSACGQAAPEDGVASLQQAVVPTYEIAEYWDAHWTAASDKLMSSGSVLERYTSAWSTSQFGANNAYYEKGLPNYELLATWYMRILGTGEVTEVADYLPEHQCTLIATAGKEIKWGLPTAMAVGAEINSQRHWSWSSWFCDPGDCKWGWNWTKLAAHYDSYTLPASGGCPAQTFHDVILIHNIQSRYEAASCQGNQVINRTDLVLARSFGIIERRYFIEQKQPAWPAWTTWKRNLTHRPERVCENGPCQCRTQYPVW
ncbi:MAG TPA: hypothetical protein VK524_04175 [Polyangiaceae bacterium]|nr:hypothetical protein [Polyangiaceae bacterium]